MTGRFTLPRAGSRAHLALTALHQIGGRADLRGWMNACTWAETIREFERVVVQRVEFLKLVDAGADGYKLTRYGIEHLGLDADAPPLVAPVVAGPRTVASGQALTRKHMMRMPLMREGALDYLAIPSRIGDQVMPHQVASSMATGSGER